MPSLKASRQFVKHHRFMVMLLVATLIQVPTYVVACLCPNMMAAQLVAGQVVSSPSTCCPVKASGTNQGNSVSSSCCSANNEKETDEASTCAAPCFVCTSSSSSPFIPAPSETQLVPTSGIVSSAGLSSVLAPSWCQVLIPVSDPEFLQDRLDRSFSPATYGRQVCVALHKLRP